MKSSKAILNGTSSSSGSSDYDKTKIFVSGLDRASIGSVFMRKILKSDLAENFTIDVVRVLEPILEFLDFFLISLQRYSLIPS
jgi:hypothetical protein